MTEVQSAIGRVVLRKLPEWLEIRRKHAELLEERVSRIPALRVTVPPRHIEHAYYKYYVFVRPELLLPDWSRDRVMQSINAEGVPCSVGSCSEIYREKAFLGEWPEGQRLPAAKELGENSLVFQVHPTLTPNDVRHTCSVIEQVMGLAAQPATPGSEIRSAMTSTPR
jgi:dTDP-4-amino-4,6-dideoxygalactose transaminase